MSDRPEQLEEHPFVSYPTRTYRWYSEHTFTDSRARIEGWAEDFREHWLARAMSSAKSRPAVYDEVRTAALSLWEVLHSPTSRSFMEAFVEADPADGRCRFTLAQIAEDVGDAEASALHLTAWLEDHSDELPDNDHLLETWYLHWCAYEPSALEAERRLAALEAAAGEERRACKRLREAIARRPRHHQAPYVELAELRARRGDSPGALDALETGFDVLWAYRGETGWMDRCWGINIDLIERYCWLRAHYPLTSHGISGGVRHYCARLACIWRQAVDADERALAARVRDFVFSRRADLIDVLGPHEFDVFVVESAARHTARFGEPKVVLAALAAGREGFRRAGSAWRAPEQAVVRYWSGRQVELVHAHLRDWWQIDALCRETLGTWPEDPFFVAWRQFARSKQGSGGSSGPPTVPAPPREPAPAARLARLEAELSMTSVTSGGEAADAWCAKLEELVPLALPVDRSAPAELTERDLETWRLAKVCERRLEECRKIS